MQGKQKSFIVIPVLTAVFTLFSTAAWATTVEVSINKVSQKMTVWIDGSKEYIWPVSTGAKGYETPSGDFKPFRMEREHFSNEWDNAPMPYSVFFTQYGHAIHGSMYVKSLGRRASHGCVRLAPENAKIFFDLVQEAGMKNTTITLKGGFFDRYNEKPREGLTAENLADNAGDNTESNKPVARKGFGQKFAAWAGFSETATDDESAARRKSVKKSALTTTKKQVAAKTAKSSPAVKSDKVKPKTGSAKSAVKPATKSKPAKQPTSQTPNKPKKPVQQASTAL